MQGYRFRVGDDLEASPPLAPGPIVRRQGEVDVLGRGQASELRLEFLPAEDVAPYVAERLGAPIASALAAFVSESTPLCRQP
jgi:hypothetical protein